MTTDIDTMLKELAEAAGECSSCGGRGRGACTECQSALVPLFKWARVECMNSPDKKEQGLITKRMVYLATFPEIEGSNDGAAEREELRGWEESRLNGYRPTRLDEIDLEAVVITLGSLTLMQWPSDVNLGSHLAGKWAKGPANTIEEIPDELWRDTPTEAAIAAVYEAWKVKA